MGSRFSLLLASLFFICINICAVGAARLRPSLLITPGAEPGCNPTQVHMALGKDATEMHISWKTAGPNCPSELIYLQSPSQEQQSLQLQAGAVGVSNAVGYSFLLSERDMCSEPAASNEFMLYLHRAKLTQLVPNSRYLYRIAGSERTLQFMSGAAPAPDHSFTFLAFGDMGDAVHEKAKSPGAASTLLRLKQEVDAVDNPAQLILHVGDISYANGDPEIWDSFMDGIEPVASKVPYMVAIGNHEYGYKKGSPGAAIDPSGASGPYQPSWGNFGPDSLGECGVMTARRFHMPQRPDNHDNAPFWYSFEQGSVHFTVISTEHNLEAGSRQYEWLQQELASVDRCATPWLVVLLHRPLYVVYPHKSNRQVGKHLRHSIEELLLQYKVDMTVAGHVHSYYRTCPVFDKTCIDEDEGDSHSSNRGIDTGASTENDTSNRYGCEGAVCNHGIVHFVIGSAGHKLSDVERGQEDWLAAKVRQFGYGRFTVNGPHSLLAEYVASEGGEVLDSVTVLSTAERDAMCNRQAAAPTKQSLQDN